MIKNEHFDEIAFHSRSLCFLSYREEGISFSENIYFLDLCPNCTGGHDLRLWRVLSMQESLNAAA